MIKKRKHPEDQIQTAIVAFLAVYESQGKLSYFAVPNGEKRDAVTGAKLKRLGTRAGVPDIVILFPGNHTIFLEVKAPKGALSESQTAWFTWLNAARYTVAVVRSVDEAKAMIDREFVRIAA